jgi:hypothetical protein
MVQYLEFDSILVLGPHSAQNFYFRLPLYFSTYLFTLTAALKYFSIHKLQHEVLHKFLC